MDTDDPELELLALCRRLNPELTVQVTRNYGNQPRTPLWSWRVERPVAGGSSWSSGGTAESREAALRAATRSVRLMLGEEFR